MTTDIPAATVPENVLHGIYRDYCLAKFNYRADAYVDAADREQHIDSDARSYYEKDLDRPLAALVEAAYAAGQDAVLAVQSEGGTIEWGARCISPHCHHHSDETVFQISDNRSNVEWYIDQPGPGIFELVRRTRRDWSEWQAVNG